MDTVLVKKVEQRIPNKFLFDIPQTKLSKKDIALRQIKRAIKNAHKEVYSF